MRDAFINSLLKICDARPEVILMTGDLGFGVLDEFRDRFPSQFLNVGVAEQNLSGVAAGLALTGHVVFTYSIGNFPTLRCLEQIRNDICYHHANVKIVTVGGGMAYGALGPSHFATEDIGIMRMLPEMTVVAPGDPTEVEALVPQIVNHPGPVYLRLGRSGEPRLVPDDAKVTLGEPNPLREGRDLLLLSTGGLLEDVLAASTELEEVGISGAVVSMPTVRPFPEAWLRETAPQYPLLVTCEEHSIHGGLGGATAEILATMTDAPPQVFFGLGPGFPDGIGSQQYLRKVNGIDAGALVQLIRAKLTSAKLTS